MAADTKKKTRNGSKIKSIILADSYRIVSSALLFKRCMHQIARHEPNFTATGNAISGV